jgi:PAS domain S-box-containing protein
MRVLVVDDDVAGRDLLETLFSMHGYETWGASDGVAALDVAREHPCDLVVTDILMPKMDGYQLCREWKADAALSSAPVVFYTATYTTREDRDFADGVGADLFIVKPTDPDELFRMVDALAREHAIGDVGPREPRIADESSVLREYNEVLVHKLEHKISELERAYGALERASVALEEEARAKTGLIERLSADIERRKRAEEQLQRTNELLSAVVDGSPLGIVATDAEGGIRMWNPRAENLFGHVEADMIGTPYSFAGERGLDDLLDAARGGSTCTSVGDLSDSDGATIEAEVCTAPLRDEQGGFDGIVALIADTTQRAQLERLKQDFVQVVSHELRTPLTTIIGYGDLLAQMGERGQLDPEKFAQLVDRMRNQGSVLAQLVDDLISVLQFQAEGLKLALTSADAADLVRKRAVAQRMSERHELVLDLPDRPVPIVCDPIQLGLAVKNLLSNAVKYSPDGGRIVVKVAADDSEIRISVTDQGVGIASEQMSTIFDLFTQLDMSTTRRFGGVGMGLYLTKRIVEAHHGHVDAASVPCQGSTFSIVLPAGGGTSSLQQR